MKSFFHQRFTINTPKGPRSIGDGEPCFVIAEVSANHEQDLEKARELVRLAARTGADAIKLQTYLPETMTLDSHKEWFLVKGEATPGEWKNQSLFELYQKAFTPWEWHKELQDLAHSLGLVFFSTPFDASAVDFLETLNVPVYKLASYEMTDIPLLKKIASTGKPIIMSVGFADLPEIDESVQALKDAGAKDVIVLYCATNYTAASKDEDCHLSTMHDLKKRYDVLVGFSDNTGGIEVPIQSALMGAVAIEKHIYLKDTKALDASFSVDENELKVMIERIRTAEKRMGKPFYGTREGNESYFRRFRRSIFVSASVKKGETLTEKNLKIIRPSNGIEPKHWENVLGKKATRDLEHAEPLKWEDFN